MLDEKSLRHRHERLGHWEFQARKHQVCCWIGQVAMFPNETSFDVLVGIGKAPDGIQDKLCMDTSPLFIAAIKYRHLIAVNLRILLGWL